MYFPFFLIPVVTVHFRDQLHLISSCWEINPGGVHLQTLGASWVTFPHASSSTGCIFSTLPGWVPAVHLGALEVRKMVSGSCASVLARAAVTERWPQVTAALDMEQPHVLPVNLPLGHLHAASEGQRSWLSRRHQDLDCEKGEAAACGPWHAGQNPPHQLLREKASRMLQQNTCFSCLPN